MESAETTLPPLTAVPGTDIFLWFGDDFDDPVMMEDEEEVPLTSEPDPLQ